MLMLSTRKRRTSENQTGQGIDLDPEKKPTCMNRDGEAYSLPTAYDRLLVTCSTSTSRDHKPDEARRWQAKRRN